MHNFLEPKRQPECLHTLLEAQVQHTPDVIAVVFEEQHLTYAGLDARANQLARYLRNLGVQRGTLVGTFAERSLEMVIALYATLKAGGAYVPIDPAYPGDRVTFMLNDAQVPVLLTQAHLRSTLPPYLGHVVTLETDWAVIGKLSANPFSCQAIGSDLAYIIYTSGSTGHPKGAMNTHHGICNRLVWMQAVYGLGVDDRVIQKTPFSFDVSVWELFWPLLTGARLVMAHPGGHRDSAYLRDLILCEAITTVHFVPSMLQTFVREPGVRACGTVLRRAISSGEALSGDLQAMFFDQFPAVALHNLYGPTEAAVDVTSWMCRPNWPAPTVPIGYPITNIQISLLDRHQQFVSATQPGELHIGGVGLARGYHRRPDLTAEKFIPDPVGTVPGSRLYKTGDLAKVGPDGAFEYLGRWDHQVKIRGFRIELGEIEVALAQHPAIRESVVVPWSDNSESLRLIAYVVGTGTRQPSTTELLSRLKRTLPDYMLPSKFLFLGAMPLTPNGKVDRKALPPPDTQRPQLEALYVSPTTPRELALARIFSKALEVTPVGIHDSFFELGGDSIRAIQVLAQAQQQGIPITLEQLFTHQTIHDLVQQLPHNQPPVLQIERPEPFALVSSEDRTRLPAGLEDAYPLTQLQIGMFYHNEKNPVSAVFHDIFTFHILYPFQQEHLQLVVNRFIARHAPMRTSFDLDSFTEPLQLVHSSARLLIAVEDLQHVDSTAQTEALTGWMAAEKRRPFDPAQAPLLRLLVHRYSTNAFQLIVSFHHAILDGWSLAVMLTEILPEYAALLGGTNSPITPPAVPYRTYMALERKALAAEDSRQFWIEKLRAPDIHMLPRWPESYRTGGTEQMRSPEIPIPGEVFAGLKTLALNAKTPLKSVLLAAHHRVMNALHGRPDVISGIITNGRPEEVDGERMVGLFLNTVPVRLRLNGGTWFELIQQMFRTERELIPHRRFPLAAIHQATGKQHFFETAFDFVHFHVYRNLDGFRDMGFMEGHYFEANSFVLFTTFMMDVTTTKLQMHIDYDPAELCADQIDMIGEYYVRTLTSIASQPHARYDEFSPLSAEECWQQLADWNETTYDPPSGKSLHALFEDQVERTPDAVALIDGIDALSYTCVNQRANQLAHRLIAKGVGPDVLVALCVERSPEMVVALLAILKAGGAYVPLDPIYPKPWLAAVLEDTQAPVLLTQTRLQSHLPDQLLQMVFLDEGNQSIEGAPNLLNPATSVNENNLVYVLYTSGSTGGPKGVSIQHRNAVSLMRWGQEQFSLEESAGVLASTSMCFDLSVFEIFLPLSRGGTVILAEHALALPTLPVASHVTLINSVPSVMRELLRLHSVPPSVRVVNLAGEPLRTVLVQQIYAVPGIQKVYDLYGPTEDTTYSTVALRSANGPDTIGRPIANEQIYLVDENQHLLPVGVTGEMLIGGSGLARGYYQRPDLTAEQFLPHPFGPDPGARVYRSGDLGRYRPDGMIEYLGRRDHQVKVRGYRIELGEIERALSQHPTVQNTVVLCREDTPGEKQLVAYVVSQAKDSLNTTNLTAFLQQKLPQYMIPAAFMILDVLPLTPNDKIDRQALPAPDGHRANMETTFVPPLTLEEELLAGIWTATLKIPQVSIHDNFFSLGGHSLRALQIISKIRSLFSVELPLRTLFEHPTVARLAVVLKSHRNQAESFQFPPLKMADRSHPLPLSFSQQRLWLLHQLEPESTAYSMPFAYRFTGTLNVTALEQSLNALLSRHESLRTHFVVEEGEPRQAISLYRPLQLPLVDLQTMPKTEQEQACHRIIMEDRAQPFDLAKGPMIRAALYRLAPEDHLFLLNLHHIISDGWSMDVFFKELRLCYQAFVENQSPLLPPLLIQYADYAVWQRECLQGEVLGALLSYWRTHLADIPAHLPLPTDKLRPPIQTFRGNNLRRLISPSLVQALKAFSQAEEVTIFMTFLAAFQLLLARHSGQEDIVIGTPVANRHRTELEGMVGLFLNTLVLRTNLSEPLRVRELVQRVRTVCLNAYDHQDLPFEKLVEELQPVRDLSRTPLFQIFFNLFDFSDSDLDLPAVTLKPVTTASMPDEPTTAKFDLELYVTLKGDTWTVNIIYNVDLFTPTTIAWMLDQYDTLLQGMVATPDAPVATLSVYGEGGLFSPRLSTPLEVPSPSFFRKFSLLDIEQSLPSRFEQQVVRNPHQVAVQTPEETWTYAELNRQANRVAHTLLQTLPDATTSSRIGLLCSPGAQMFAALLGVLKAGQTYVPLEPTLPQARVESILADATASMILTTTANLARVLPIRQQGYHIINIDEDLQTTEQTNPIVPVSPDAIAYLLYTSGTTGVPKGVMQTHRNVLHHIRVYTNNLKIEMHDRLTLLTSYSFDAAVMDIFGALLNGATLCPFNLQEATFEELTPWLKEQAVTIYHSTPTVYRYWLKHVSSPTFPALRLVVLGGEEATCTDFEAYQRHLGPECFFVNGLGPTESTVSLQFIGYHTTQLLGQTVPVGYPVDETEVVLLDETGRMTEIFGEIALRSRFVAIGYWQRAELTQRVFSELPSGGMRQYCTGDLGRYRPDGTLEFMGRKDGQVKLRGYRIELGEIESVLSQHPTVHNTVVLCREDTPGEKQLVAYVTPVIEASLEPATLRTYLHTKLPDYMLPATFVVLHALPLTPNGKVDRKALPVPDKAHREQAGVHVPPRTPLEEFVAEIWGNLLKIDHIGIHDSFFELGGHSLLAAQAIARLRHILELNLPLRTLFEYPTLAQFAGEIDVQLTNTYSDSDWPRDEPPYQGSTLTP